MANKVQKHCQSAVCHPDGCPLGSAKDLVAHNVIEFSATRSFAALRMTSAFMKLGCDFVLNL